MHGTLDIRRTTDSRSDVQSYQVRYEDLAGNSFAGSMTNDDLRELLYERLGLNVGDEDLDQDYERLLRDGHVIFPEIEIREDELAGAGLKYLPAEG